MRDSDESIRRRQFRTMLIFLAPLLLGFSLVSIIDGDIVESIVWAVVVLVAMGWLLVQQASTRPSRSRP